MKNQNYNLIKLLHNKLDNHWRITKYYLADAEDLDCRCKEILEEIKKDDERHIELLRDEIKNHVEKEIFN